MKKVFKSIVIIIAILFLFDSVSFADTDFKKQIKAEDGSTFEKIIAGMIGGIAQTVFDFSINDSIGVGFKDYDDLIFNKNNDELSPFTDELWSKTMKWYKIFSIVSESLILLATVILAYKIITAGNSVTRKKDAKESLLRLVLGGILRNEQEKKLLDSWIRDKPNVTYMGYISYDTMLDLYKRAKVFALPSIYEGVGVVALDAAAMGCDIVITRLGGPKEYYNNMAVEVNPYSIDEIGLAVSQLMQGQTFQPDLRKYILENYSLKNISEQLEMAFSIVL